MKMYLRPIDQHPATPIPQVEVAFDPVFSPDSGWLAYGRPSWLGDPGIWKIPVAGGSPTLLLDRYVDFTWGADETIIFSQGGSLWRVSALGGEPEAVVEPDEQGEITAYLRPDFLPGGRAVLAEIRRGGGVASAGIAVVSLETGKPTIVAEQGTDPLYVASGHILYARGGSIWAKPFDAKRLEVLGAAVAVRQGVRVESAGRAHYTVSSTGTLVYIGGEAVVGSNSRRLAWLDRRGMPTGVDDEMVRGFNAVRLSLDGRQIAVEIEENGGAAIWIHGIESGTWARLTDVDYCLGPLWTLDSSDVLFNCDAQGAGGRGAIYRRAADFSEERQLVLKTDGGVFPMSWGSDGALVLHEMIAGARRRRILVMAMGEDRTPFSLLDDSGQYNQRAPMVSPNGRWFAYVESQSGQDEVYVRPFPGAGPRIQISRGVAFSPMWGRDESELFYRSEQGMMVARIETEPEFQVVDRELLFPSTGQLIYPSRARTAYDYDRRNDRFLVAMDAGGQDSEFTVVVNWFEELERLAPTGR